MKTLSLVTAIFAAWAGVAAAQSNFPSDTMIVTGLPTGACTATIVEGAAAPEATGVCGLSVFGFPDGVFTGAFLPLTVGFLPSAAVVLLEPLGEPIDPGSAPVFWPGTNRYVSDIVVRYNVNPFGFAFISDGHASLATWVTFLSTAPAGAVVALDETGVFQDLTTALGIPAGTGVTVRIISDVPEPGTAALLLAGAGVVGWAARRRTRG